MIGQDAAKRSSQMSKQPVRRHGRLPAQQRPVARSRASTSRCGRESLKVGVSTAARAMRSSLPKESRRAGRDRSGCSEEKQPDETAASALARSIASAARPVARSRASTSRCGRERLKVGVSTAARAMRSSLSKGSRGAGRDRSGCSEEKQPDEQAASASARSIASAAKTSRKKQSLNVEVWP